SCEGDPTQRRQWGTDTSGYERVSVGSGSTIATMKSVGFRWISCGQSTRRAHEHAVGPVDPGRVRERPERDGDRRRLLPRRCDLPEGRSARGHDRESPGLVPEDLTAIRAEQRELLAVSKSISFGAASGLLATPA